MRFIKAQASALVATGVQFSVSFLLLYIWEGYGVAANVTGVACGGITNFMINRKWVYQKGNDTWNWQAIKYIIVWFGNLIVNTTCFWVLTNYTAIDQRVAVVMASVITAVGYNYGMQKRFVFK
ncbi:GtrA family protein [Chitinophaga silvisoli]|uniref:GtrA family protein n=1 Tax=Chitinophaga silvisoli TaxID=2291814 RepID=A0A3E1P961_9BACT|nr:GtrA family protein [Chitinophaga silvisoli]RFM36719.1 GtrA family protein [Chitinophaga silvisoli]